MEFFQVASPTEDPARHWICEVYLLQSPMAIVRDGQLVEGGWRLKSLELLAFLAVHPRGVSKDQILEALWPEQDPERNKYKFWHTVSHLRNRLRGPGSVEQVVLRVDDFYSLDLTSVWVDVIAFQSLLKCAPSGSRSIDRLQEAIRLYKDEFCASRYYSWASLHSEHFRRLLLQAEADLRSCLGEVFHDEFAE